MSAILLDGRELAKQLREQYRAKVTEASAASGKPVTLETLRVGDAEDARLYEEAIGRLMEKVGIRHLKTLLPAAAAAGDVRAAIHASASNAAVTGTLVLSPMPKHLPYQALVAELPPHRDAEGTRYGSAGAAGVFPPTASACFELVRAAGLPIAGKHAVVIGRSRIVGRPAAELLLEADATVTLCHSKTQDLQSHVASADIIVAAVGRAALIRGAWIKPGAVVVDAGENVVDGHPSGDVEFAAAQSRAGFITPVPGGVGPVTSLMLVRNLIALSASAPQAHPAA
jgi:methylenetetrahydrofolate dehydrogenase (NADP+)/methenyltetrahydrofolate cyclohydrolase